jgi:hypothetical protein
VSAAWFTTAVRLFDSARGNDRFVKVRAVQKLLSAWQEAWTLSPDTVAAPTVDEATGLPPWAVWADVLAEQRQGQSLPPSPPVPSATRGDDARARLRRREAAARVLARVPPLPLEAGRVDVRRVDGARALVTITLDRVSAAGLLVRLSADVTVTARGKKGGIVVDDDRARAAAPLVAVLERSAALPAPAVAVQLAGASDDVVVERVTRGVIGPASLAGRGTALAPYAGDDGALLVLSFEELHGEVATVSDNDVFATDDLHGLWSALPTELRGLKVFRDARVVATPTAAARVAALATRRGTKTVITTVVDDRNAGGRRS